MNYMNEDDRAAARAIEDVDEDDEKDNNGKSTAGPVEFGARKELLKLTVRSGCGCWFCVVAVAVGVAVGENVMHVFTHG